MKNNRALTLAAVAVFSVGCSSEPASEGELDAAADVVPSDDFGTGDTAINDSGAGETSNPMDSAMLMDAMMDTAPATAAYVYAGCGNGEILQFGFDVATGELTPKAKFAGGSNPSFLAVDPTAKYLYAVNEGSSEVAAFSIAKGTGALTLLNRVSSMGNGPAFVSVDKTGKYALVANYGGGNVNVFKIEPDGKLGARTGGDAPGAKAHSILTGPSNKFAYVPTLGIDAIAQYAFDDTKGTLTPLSPPKASTAAGAGPRHIDFHPSGAFAFVMNETDDTVMSFKIEASGALTSQQTLTTLPSGFAGSMNSGADIHVHPNGKFLYSSNRGHDSIAMFAIDAAGKLTSIGHEPTGGQRPRNFHIEPSGQILLAANQSSNNIVTFRIGADGKLTKLKTAMIGAAPAYVGVVHVPL
jgi:6-phosphogluconolactonase